MKIRRLATEEAATCARLMATSEPWITLKRNHDAAMGALLDPTREVWVAIAAGEIQGFVILALNGPFSGYLQTICVAERARGQGVGRRLMEFVEQRVARVSPAVFLCVSSFNTGARALYERLGYRLIGEIPDYVERGYSEVLMWKQSVPLNEFVLPGTEQES